MNFLTIRQNTKAIGDDCVTGATAIENTYVVDTNDWTILSWKRELDGEWAIISHSEIACVLFDPSIQF